MAIAQTIVETLVVRVVEPLLLHGPFEFPIDLGHEAEPRVPLADGARGVGPEGRSATSPSTLEDVGQNEHGHVAPHAVALPGDAEELAAHRLLRRRIAVIELQR